MLVTIFAITIEDLIPDPDTLFEDSDEAGDVVKFGFLQHTLFADTFVENLYANMLFKVWSFSN
jgi:hypothetical protein